MATLKYLKTKGSIGLHYGLGVDEVAVNFEDLPGLITLAGKNGQGKTTFLEMLSPFAVFPSRKAKDPRKYNLKKQFSARDSYREVGYHFQGKDYVFRVEIPAGTTMSPEGYIWCDGIPLVKGKISQYNKMVTDLFGSETLFYSSMFSCQGGKKLTDLPVGEFKALLIELLGLNKYVEYWRNVGKVISECEKELTIVTRELEGFEKKSTDIDMNTAAIDKHRADLERQSADLITTRNTLMLIQNDIDTLIRKADDTRKKEAIAKEKRDKRTELETQIDTLTAEQEEVNGQYLDWLSTQAEKLLPYKNLVYLQDDILNASTAIQQIQAEKDTWATQLADLTEKGTACREQIAELGKTANELTVKRAELQTDSELKALVEKQQSIALEIDQLQTLKETTKIRLDAIEADVTTFLLKQQLQRLQSAETLLSTRPDGCTIDGCPFIVDALKQVAGKPAIEKEILANQEKNKQELTAAKIERLRISDSLAAIEKEQTDINVKYLSKTKEISNGISGITVKISENAALERLADGRLKDIKAQYLQVKAAIDAIPARIEKLTELAEKKPDLDSAKQILAHAEETAAEKKKEQDMIIAGYLNKKHDIGEKITAIDTDIMRLGLTVSSEQIVTDIDRETGKKLVKEQEIKNIQAYITELEKNIAVCAEKSKLFAADAARINVLKDSERHIRKEIAKWAYIRAAVSKSGLQALEIASAAPLLTGIANDLLASAFGGEFYVDLVTLDPETGAEILDIMITREDGKTFPLADYSGGESVWILQAFKAAQILVNAEKSGVHFATCFADEESGALDKDKAERFIKMYRALMLKGRFEKLFFISHIPDCQAMADHVLTFQAGGIVSESNITLN